MQKIPTTIITGFLGSGKTSLIRYLMQQPHGKSLAFLINEFGTLGMDRDILLGCGIEGCSEQDIVELANGCICCTVAEDFVPAIRHLLSRDKPVDHIIIETSGLALPKPLIQAFHWPEIAARLSVDGVITVLDADALQRGLMAQDEQAIAAARAADDMLDHDTPLGELFADQLACADLVILNKADLLTPAQLQTLQDRLAPQCPPGVSLLPAHQAQVPAQVALGLGAESEQHIAARHTHHDHHHEHDHDHDHDDFASCSIVLPDDVMPEAVLNCLPAVIAQYHLLRVKGFLHHAHKPRRQVVQAVGPRVQYYFDRDWHVDEARQSQLVFIAHHHTDFSAAEAQLIAACRTKN